MADKVPKPGAMFHDDLMEEREKKLFHDAFAGMSDAVAASLRMFLWVLDEVTGVAYKDRRDIHAVPLMLLFDFAEAIDGVTILARPGSARNCSQLLRTALEVQLALKYMMEHKDTYEQRCLAYEFYHLRDKLKWVQRCDPATENGKRLRAELNGDAMAGIFDVKGRNLAEEARDLEARMNSTRYTKVRDELARMKKEKIRDGGWFSVWDGPKTIRELAIHLKCGAIYEALYRSWSSVSHGESAINRASTAQSNEARLTPIRWPEKLTEMCRHACHLCNAMTLFLVDGLVPHLREEMKRRYVVEIQPGLAFIDTIKGL